MANEIQADYASGSTLYAVIRNRAGHVWHPPQRVFEAWGTSGRTAEDYAVTLTDKTGSRYIGDFDPNVPAGDYCLQVFLQAGALPADTDTLVSSREILWTGTGELTPVKMLANKAVHDNVAKTLEYYDDDGQTILIGQTWHDDGFVSTRTLQ